jgi:small subunit ribosomal protein S21
MTMIKVINNQVDKALNKLRHKMNQEGILKELKNRRFHESKSEKRRRKSEEAIRRNFALKRKMETMEDNSFQTKYLSMLNK